MDTTEIEKTRNQRPVTVGMLKDYTLSGALVDVLRAQTSLEANYMSFISLAKPEKGDQKEERVVALLQNNLDDKSDGAQALVNEAGTVTSEKVRQAIVVVQLKDSKTSVNFIMGVFLAENEKGESIFLLQPLYKTKAPLEIKPK